MTKDGYDYYCGKCNCSFSIQSDKEIDVPVENCCFCGRTAITWRIVNE